MKNNLLTIILLIFFSLLKTTGLFSQKGQFEFSFGVIPNLTLMNERLKEPKGGITSSLFFKYNLTNRFGLVTGLEYQYLKLRRANKVHERFQLIKFPVLLSYNLSENLDFKNQINLIGGYSFSMISDGGEIEWTDKDVQFIRFGVESKFKTKKALDLILTHYIEWSNFKESRYSQLYLIHFGVKIGLSRRFFQNF